MLRRICGVCLGVLLLGSAGHALELSSVFTDNMVLQRNKPVQVWGTVNPGEHVTVQFAGQSIATTADFEGNWIARLEPMSAQASPHTLSITSSGGKEISLHNVLVGDIWLFARQAYIDVSLGRTPEGKSAVTDLPGAMLRVMQIETIPSKTLRTNLDPASMQGWQEVDTQTALAMSAAAFYLGRDLVNDLEVPIGIIDLDMKHHFGIGWLSERAIEASMTSYPDDREIRWLPDWMREQADSRDSGQAQRDLDAYHEAQLARNPDALKPSLGLHPLQNPMYPSGGYHAVIHPLRNLTMKGILLQLGNDYPFIAYRELDRLGKSTDNVELNAAWGDNYVILKSGYRVTPVTLPYVPSDWRRTFNNESLPIGLILPPGSDLDVYAAHNREIRELHRRTAALQGLGLILPGMRNIPQSGQPADEKLLAERSRQWMLGAVYQKADVTASGPLVERVETDLSRATVHFEEGTAEGLYAIGDGLDQFETAGPDRIFTRATARIEGSTIKLQSDGPILFVRYNWNAFPEPTLLNAADLPALPFSTDRYWEFAWIPPREEDDLPEEYRLTADKWGASNVAIINGLIANLASGDSEPIPRRPGPTGIYSSPFGPNIYVINVEIGSPADGKLEPGDLIYGVNGRIFDDGPDVADDAQYRVFADAITFSESAEGQGNLLLHVRRGSDLLDIGLTLQVLGSYSDTKPFYCEKSRNIVRNAENWASVRFRPESGMPVESNGFLHTDLLFLLASGNPEHQGLVRRAVYRMLDRLNPVPVTSGMDSRPWHTGHDSMLLGEYFHATGDRNVLPYLKYLADLSAESQLKPQDETPPYKEAAQTEEQVGGWRHRYPADPNRWKSGYGLLPHVNMACVLGMQLALEAGLEIDELALKRGIHHAREGRAEHAFLLYSYHNLRRTAPIPVNPDAEAAGLLCTMNGTVSMAAALFRLLDDHQPADICARTSVYAFNNTRHGHGGMFFNNYWTPIGAWSSGEEGFKHFMQNQTWWRELFRRHDGSFNQVGRGGIGIAYATPYVASQRRLRILGAPRSAFGTDIPAFLEPAVAAHRDRNYALCEQLIVEHRESHTVAPADRIVMDQLLESVRTLQASIAHDLALTERLIEEGKYFYASLELPQLKGVVAPDDPQLQAILAVLASPDGRSAIAAHRRQVEREPRREPDGALRKLEDRNATGKWIDLVTDRNWKMRVVEHISHAPESWVANDFDDKGWNDAVLPISWTMYHTALFRRTFTVEDKNAFDGLRLSGRFFQQANVVVYLNGELVAKIDEMHRGIGQTYAPFTDFGLGMLRNGENTIAVRMRHKRRWGPYRGVYKTAETVGFTFEGRKAGSGDMSQ